MHLPCLGGYFNLAMPLTNRRNPLPPPNMATPLSPTGVSVKLAQGGGGCPGQWVSYTHLEVITSSLTTRRTLIIAKFFTLSSCQPGAKYEQDQLFATKEQHMF